MNDQPSPLSQRVRRLLGTSALIAEGRPEHPPPNGHRPDTGLLFESQISRLSSALRDLRAIDRQREAELRALRERIAIAEAVAQAALVERLSGALGRVDALIEEAARLLQPPPDPPPANTLFDRMRARATASNHELARREALVTWASALIDLRAQIAAVLDE